MVICTFSRKAEEVLVYKDNLGLQYLAGGLFSEHLPYVVVGGPFLNAQRSKEELLDLLDDDVLLHRHAYSWMAGFTHRHEIL